MGSTKFDNLQLGDFVQAQADLHHELKLVLGAGCGKSFIAVHAASLAFCARPGRPHLRERLLVEATD